MGSWRFEQTERRVDTARGDTQLVQRFRIVPQARARFVRVPRGQQPSQLHERHFTCRGADVECGQHADARNRGASSSRLALTGAEWTLHR